MVAVSYLGAVEGPLWTAIRGTGLAYGANFEKSVSSGHVLYQVYRSPDSFKAFVVSKRVVESFISGTTAFNELALQGAVSSIVLGFANGQANMVAAAQDSFIRQVIRELPNDYNEIILREVRHVTTDQIRQAMKEILLPLFVPETCNVFITCAKIMEGVSPMCPQEAWRLTVLQKLVRDFRGINFQAEVQPLAFFQDDYGLKSDRPESDADAEDDYEEDEEEDEDSGEDHGEDDEEGDDMSNADVVEVNLEEQIDKPTAPS